MAWIWLGILVACAVAWLAYRYWRRRHPAPAPQRSYSQRLEQQLAKRQVATKRKRRGGPATKDQPHRR